jgi:CheY-like chemotaxis protein
MITEKDLINIFINYKDKLSEELSLKDTILLYENMIKDITLQKNSYILLVDNDSEDRQLYSPTFDIHIPLSDEHESILYECYFTKKYHYLVHARRSFLYRQRVDNFIDIKMNNLLVIPILDDNKEEVIAIIWIATIGKESDIFRQDEIKILVKLSNEIKAKIKYHTNDTDRSIINDIGITKDSEHIPLNLLIVDNSTIILKFIEFSLKEYDIKIITAVSSLESIEKFKYNRIDMIIMDESTIGISGHQAIKMIRQIEIEKGYDSIPIFGLTSDATKTTVDDILASGANLVLLKPIEKHDIINAIEKYRDINLKLS